MLCSLVGFCVDGPGVGPPKPGLPSVQSAGGGLGFEAFERGLRDDHVDQVFDLRQLVALVAADERERLALRAHAGGAADAVDVHLGVFGMS